MLGNTIEAAADLGGMAAALGIFIPLPIPWIVVMVAVVLLALQVLASYATIRSIFRWLALALLAYVAAALLAQPNPGDVLAGTLLPSVRFDREFLSIVVAIIGTSLSAISTPGNLEGSVRSRAKASRALCRACDLTEAGLNEPLPRPRNGRDSSPMAFDDRQAQPRAQLQRYGTDVAKWRK